MGTTDADFFLGTIGSEFNRLIPETAESKESGLFEGNSGRLSRLKSLREVTVNKIG